MSKNDSLYKACLDAISDMHMIACDADGKIFYYNEASSKMDMIPMEEVIGKNMFEMFQSKEETGMRRVLRTKETCLDFRSSYYHNGKEIVSLSSSYPIMSHGKFLGVISVNRSIASAKILLERSMELQKQLNEVSSTKKNGTYYSFESIVGNSEGIKKAVSLGRRAADSSAPVLIYGETGTGKEPLAQGIHNASSRCSKPFVAVNCAAIPETLLESTLFGTTKGAFTGADNSAGLIEQAKDGTLFLDEINSMPLLLQAKLLRALQELTFRRVGGTTNIPVSCRIISSCNKNPLECVEKNLLRNDLYYRLAVICIEVPPLRDRGEDIVLIANHYLAMYSKIYGISHLEMSQELKDIFMSYSWPGNVRELKHVIESSLLCMEPGEELKLHHFPDVFVQALSRQNPKAAFTKNLSRVSQVTGPYDLEKELIRIKYNAIISALDETNWNISKAA